MSSNFPDWIWNPEESSCWSNTEKLIIHNPPEKWTRLKRITCPPKDSLVTKTKVLFILLTGGCLPCILVSEPEINTHVFGGVKFLSRNDPESFNEIPGFKAEKGFNFSRPGRWMFFPTSQTADHERYPIKYCEIFKRRNSGYGDESPRIFICS